MTTQDWIAGLACGGEAAWERFFEELGPLIQAIGLSMGLSAEERDEVLQGAALRVLERLPALRAPESFPSWVYGIALRLSLDLHRRRRRRAEIEGAAGREGETDGVLAPSVLADLVRLEQIARVQDGLDRLDDRCRQLLELLYFRTPAPSYREVARELGAPIGSIGPTRGRCLQKLLEAIPDVFADEPRVSKVGIEAGGEREPKR